MAETLARPRASSSTIRSRTPTRSPSGDVEWLFVPLEAAAKMRASFILLGPAAGPLRAGHHQQPRRRPDRPAAGRPARRCDAGAGRRDRLPERLLLRDRARAGCAAAEVRFPFVSVMGTENAMLAATLAEGHTVIRPAAQEPEVDDLIAFLRKMGADGRADRARTRSRSRAASACAARSTGSSRTGSRPARSSSRRPSRAARSRSRARRATHLGAFLERPRAGRASASPAARDTIEVDGDGPARRRLPGDATSRPPRIRVWPRTSSRRRACC